MNVHAIADFHLPGGTGKTMDRFGPAWTGHVEKLERHWREVVAADDLVLMPGDFSWGMRLADVMPELDWLGTLPGHKVLLRGNHDYWWPSISRLRAALPDSVSAVQNDALRFGELAVCGSRGWVVPGSPPWGTEGGGEGDERIYRRELERLRLSLDAARQLGAARTALMLHYPPTGPGGERSGFTDLIEAYRPDVVVYGHLHGVPVTRSLREWRGIPCHLVAADALGFRPLTLQPA